MKNNFQIIFLLGLTMLITNEGLAQTAKLQAIHNASDPSADTVDVYADGLLLFDNFVYRTATPFIDVQAGILVNVGIAPANSTSVNDTIKNFEINLTSGQNYIAVATGVLTPGNFAINPDGANTGFSLFLQDNIRLSSQTPGNTEFVILHGATDAPTVDVVIRNSTTLSDNATYGEISGYVSVQDTSYIIDVTDSGQTNIISTYNVDLSLLADSSAVLFTSGFIDPTANQNGAAFGLFAALTDGSITEFPSLSIAFLQAIHNCSDPVADSLDIYALGNPAIDNFKFRTATNFIGVPAGIPINVGVALGNSTSINDTIKNLEVILENGKNYYAMAVGVVDTSDFAANPDGKDISFNLLLIDYAKLSSANPGDHDFIAIHACTDAPTVDIAVNGGGPVLFDNASFGDYTPYIPVAASTVNLDVTPGNNNSIIIGTYYADLTSFNGQTSVIFASGFIDPLVNQNGPDFGLWAALNDGTVFPLTNVTGIHEPAIEKELFNLGPNPAGDFTILQFNQESDQNWEVILTNSTAQIVGNYKSHNYSNSCKIETSGLKKGLYFIKAITDQKIVVKKLVIN